MELHIILKMDDGRDFAVVLPQLAVPAPVPMPEADHALPAHMCSSLAAHKGTEAWLKQHRGELDSAFRNLLSMAQN